MIEDRALVVVRIAGGGLVTEEHLRQLQRIVGIAGFGSFARLDDRGEIVGGVEMFAFAVAAEGQAAAFDDRVSKELCGVSPRGVATELCDSRVADGLGDGCLRGDP